MKTFVLLLAIAASTVVVGAAGSQKKTSPSGSKKSEAEKIYELPKTGRNLERQGGGWINVEASGAQLVVKFFDVEKKPVDPDVDRATARCRYATKSDITRTVLSREGDALKSPGNVRPPHNFLVTLTLLRGDDTAEEPGGVVEIFNFKYP